jgi:hypothetical protein
MDKEAVEQIRKNKMKERKEKQARKALIVLIIVEIANFITAWSSSTMKEVGDRFHYNFKVGLQIHPCGYRGVNLGSTTQV